MKNPIRISMRSYRIFDSLVSFLDRGLRDDRHELVVDTAPILARCAQVCITGDVALKFRVAPSAIPEDTGKDLLAAYLEHVRRDRCMVGSDQLRPWAIPMDHPLYLDLLAETLGLQALAQMGHPAEQPTRTETAVQYALWGWRLMKTRATVLSFLSSFLCGQGGSETAKGALAEVQKELSRRASMHALDYSRFVLMTGDSQLMAQARGLLFDECFAGGRNLMPYLTDNRFGLDSYRGTEEQEFREELRQAAPPRTTEN